MIAIDDVERARETVSGRLRHTPLLSSRTLGERLGCAAFLKAELLQRTGSFKPRGALNKLASLTREERARGVVGISAGNHAQALAYAAALEDLDALVVMWRGASAAKIAATRGYGAEVDLTAGNPAEAFERLEEVLRDTGRTLVHPFDDPAVMAGQGTVGLEIMDDVPEADVVVVPIGGGGLISGVSTAVKGRRPDARVIGVEPQGSAAMRLALDAGEPVPLAPVSVADGLNAPFAGTNALAVVRERVDEVVLVTEEEIEAGFRFLYERAKLACEPAGAAATCALLAGKVSLEQGETVVAVVSGGNVAGQTASAILASA
jgi:threonine dehydratase